MSQSESTKKCKNEERTDRPPRKTRTLTGGETVYEASDCRFVASPSGTVHERGEWDGDEYEFCYHPKCGQRLPSGSMWSQVDAESVEEAVLRYNLEPCTQCFDRAGRLEQWRSAIHSNLAYSSPADVPADVLRKAGLEKYINSE